jgi:hypothetical protein
MNPNTQRSILRWIHIVFGLPLVGFVYGPPGETEPYRYMFQYVFVPGLLVTGLWMWKGHVVGRLFSKRSG